MGALVSDSPVTGLDRGKAFNQKMAVVETIAQTRYHRHTRLLLSIGLTDATINRRYLSRYRGDVLAYAHSDRFGTLCILSCC